MATLPEQIAVTASGAAFVLAVYAKPHALLVAPALLGSVLFLKSARWLKRDVLVAGVLAGLVRLSVGIEEHAKLDVALRYGNASMVFGFEGHGSGPARSDRRSLQEQGKHATSNRSDGAHSRDVGSCLGPC